MIYSLENNICKGLVKVEGISDKKKFNVKNASEWIKLLLQVMAILSLIATVAVKYISSSRCLYFDFDLDYFDFSLSNTSKFILILFIVGTFISTLLGISFTLIWIKPPRYFEKKSHKIFIILALIILCLFFLEFILSIFIPLKSLRKSFSIFIYIFSFLICMVFQYFQIDVGNMVRSIVIIL